MFPSNEYDEKITTLGRQATQYSNDNKWNEAILCLEDIWQFMPLSEIDYGAKTLVRLPKYLQQAGRFAEAEQKFQQLINSADKYAELVSKDHDLKEFYEPFTKHLFLYDVYDAMRIVYKREKLLDKSNEFAELAQQHYEIGQKYGEQQREKRKQQVEEHKKWKEECRKELDIKEEFQQPSKF